MKYNVSVNNKTYEVEIEDINARPIVAHIEGKRFEVMPEVQAQQETHSEIKPAVPQVRLPAGVDLTANKITAPLPGTVVELFVKPGDQVETGQVVLVIEAMKMKNSIRSTCSGLVQEVLVNTGQSVAHKQLLVKLEE